MNGRKRSLASYDKLRPMTTGDKWMGTYFRARASMNGFIRRLSGMPWVLHITCLASVCTGLVGGGKSGRLLPVPSHFRTGDDHRGNRHLDAPRVVALATGIYFTSRKRHLIEDASGLHEALTSSAVGR